MSKIYNDLYGLNREWLRLSSSFENERIFNASDFIDLLDKIRLCMFRISPQFPFILDLTYIRIKSLENIMNVRNSDTLNFVAKAIHESLVFLDTPKE